MVNKCDLSSAMMHSVLLSRQHNKAEINVSVEATYCGKHRRTSDLDGVYPICSIFWSTVCDRSPGKVSSRWTQLIVP